MLVTKRKVSRWFVNGKGYATETAAYRSISTKQLKQLIWRDAVELHRKEHPRENFIDLDSENSGNWIHRAYMAMFPLPKPSPDCWFERNPIDFDARKAWIDKRTKELMEEDQP
jgi:hypothetical protein